MIIVNNILQKFWGGKIHTKEAIASQVTGSKLALVAQGG